MVNGKLYGGIGHPKVQGRHVTPIQGGNPTLVLDNIPPRRENRFFRCCRRHNDLSSDPNQIQWCRGHATAQSRRPTRHPMVPKGVRRRRGSCRRCIIIFLIPWRRRRRRRLVSLTMRTTTCCTGSATHRRGWWLGGNCRDNDSVIVVSSVVVGVNRITIIYIYIILYI